MQHRNPKGGLCTQNAKRPIRLKIAFSAYCILMLWLLLWREKSSIDLDYISHLQLTPLTTVRLYWNVFTNPALSHLLPEAMVNLPGNILVFLPFGALLPAAFPALAKFGRSMLCAAVCILGVELTQLITLRGYCDIDDLILNLVGTAMGYGLFRLLSPKAAPPDADQ